MNGFQGGADLPLSGLATLDAGEKNAALVDVTFPAATATSNETATRKWAPMENIDRCEEKKIAHTDYHADAATNGRDFYPCAMFKDTLTSCSGSCMQSLMGRLAATRGRVEFNGDLHRECGHRDGMWTTSNVLHCWRARMLITLAVSREAHIKKMSDELHHSMAWRCTTMRMLRFLLTPGVRGRHRAHPPRSATCTPAPCIGVHHEVLEDIHGFISLCAVDGVARLV